MSDHLAASPEPAPASADANSRPVPARSPALPSEAIPWDTIDGLVRWLDRESALPAEQEQLLRVLKLSEEAGEVAQAVIGATGQNPRKGHSHT